MAIKPILFNTDMVQAILEDRKTVTRRVVKPQHLAVLDSPYHREHPGTPGKALLEKLCQPPYAAGDVLYVREAWAMISDWTNVDPEAGMFDWYIYKADWTANDHQNWHPSIHMPREAARIFLRVKDVRVERLQDINTIGAYKEGIANCQIDPLCVGTCDNCMQAESPLHKFERLWDSTIKKPANRAPYGWEANPWVWVIEFERISKEEVPA